jgi:hypothetical protein
MIALSASWNINGCSDTGFGLGMAAHQGKYILTAASYAQRTGSAAPLRPPLHTKLSGTPAFPQKQTREAFA